MSFRTILEHKAIEGKFAFVNVGERKDTDDCIDCLNRFYPDYSIKEIGLSDNNYSPYSRSDNDYESVRLCYLQQQGCSRG